MEKQWKCWLIGLMACCVFVTACDDDDDDGSSPDMQKVYTLNELGGSGVNGTVTFRKSSASATLVIIQVSGTQEGDSHPAHIHSGNAGTGGPIAIDLAAVSGGTGRSETTVTELNDGTSITYEQLIDYDGHVNLHKSVAEMEVMITQGNIGANSDGADDGGGNGGY